MASYAQVLLYVVAGISYAGAAAIEKRATSTVSSSSSSTVPDYFQTSPELYAGPTTTGAAPFLAETNPAHFPTTSYIPNSPLGTQVPIVGNTNNENIFQLHGHLSHCFPNPDGFGVDEYPLPISYQWERGVPTGRINSQCHCQFNATGALSFLNTWSYQLGAEILVLVGKQELFVSGVLHYYQYGHLYPNNGSKIIARSTTQDRMTQSAKYFLAGFFDLQWIQNATLELIIEQNNFNNSLADSSRCHNANTGVSAGGTNATTQWANIYLANATSRIQDVITGFNWTVADSVNAQMLCAHKTVAFEFSHFCNLFTYEEWPGFEYGIDIAFAGNNAFQSPTGRAVGIGYVEEILARLQHHVISTPIAQVNVTLDNNTGTFPLD